MSNDDCNTCTPHLDRIRADLLALMTAPRPMHEGVAELVQTLMGRIAPHLHAAAEQAQALGERPNGRKTMKDEIRISIDRRLEWLHCPLCGERTHRGEADCHGQVAAPAGCDSRCEHD